MRVSASGAARRRVDSTDPVSTGLKPTIIGTIRLSSSTATPATAATAELT
jgi:hypothetical protein